MFTWAYFCGMYAQVINTWQSEENGRHQVSCHCNYQLYFFESGSLTGPGAGLTEACSADPPASAPHSVGVIRSNANIPGFYMGVKKSNLGPHAYTT